MLESVRRAGSHGLLVEFASIAEALAFQRALETHPIQGQRELVPGATTVLVGLEAGTSLVAVERAIRMVELSDAAAGQVHRHLLKTTYTGPDLAGVAQLTGLSVDGVVAAHSGQDWTVAFGGFAPGFAYLVGENRVLDVPRRDVPRVLVPAGSVGLAGEYSAVYPSESPGGWQLIGTSSERLWDLEVEPPALLHPGDVVSFVPVHDTAVLASASQSTAAEPEPDDGLVVVNPGFFATVQDLGRPGFAQIGVGRSGALDRGALRSANRLVGNAPTAAGIELLPGGVEVEARGDRVIAITGAPAELSITGPAGSRHVDVGVPFALRDGETLALAESASGFRSYLAVRGGIAVAPVLGSRSRDVLSALGPEPLHVGTVLAVGTAIEGPVEYEPERSGAAPDEPFDVILGPRDDWFDAAAIETLLGRDWIVSGESNRVGLRLLGDAVIATVRDGQLGSEGAVTGSIQIPPSGSPIVFLADHPVTGGYPIIAVIADADLDRAAQLAPGERMTFRLAREGVDDPA